MRAAGGGGTGGPEGTGGGGNASTRGPGMAKPPKALLAGTPSRQQAWSNKALCASGPAAGEGGRGGRCSTTGVGGGGGAATWERGREGEPERGAEGLWGSGLGPLIRRVRGLVVNKVWSKTGAGQQGQVRSTKSGQQQEVALKVRRLLVNKVWLLTCLGAPLSLSLSLTSYICQKGLAAHLPR